VRPPAAAAELDDLPRCTSDVVAGQEYRGCDRARPGWQAGQPDTEPSIGGAHMLSTINDLRECGVDPQLITIRAAERPWLAPRLLPDQRVHHIRSNGR
jgi:hypothetical protein